MCEKTGYGISVAKSRVRSKRTIPMQCTMCEEEAIGRCYSCGILFCAAHGTDDCMRCETAVAAGDPRPDRMSTRPMAEPDDRHRPAWWRPQQAEEFSPPACYECGGLTRRTCRNCRQMYCKDHAGSGDLCKQCATSSRIGTVILAVIFALVGGLVVYGFMSR